MTVSRWITATLCALALANVLDDFPRPPPDTWQLQPLSGADRHDLSLSSRERGLLRERRGTLRVPDLYGFVTPATLGDDATIVAELEVPDGSWFDLILDADRERRTVVRLSTRPGESWIADVREWASHAPLERSLAVPGGCLAGRSEVHLALTATTISARVGSCAELTAERPAGRGRAGVAAGLGALELWRFQVDGPGLEPYQLVVVPPALRLVSCGAIAAAFLAIGEAARRLVRRMRPRRGEPAGVDGIAKPAWAHGIVWMCLGVAALPVVPWPIAVPFVLLAVVTSRSRGRMPQAAADATRVRRPRSRVVAVASAPLMVATLLLWTLPTQVPPAPDTTPVIATLETRGIAEWVPGDGDADRQRATTVDVDVRSDGAAVVYVDAPATEPGVPLRPLLYPDLGSMAPGLVIERNGARLAWSLVSGDLVHSSGHAPVGPLRLAHRAGSIELRRGDERLARIPGLPARSGVVRVLPVDGRPEVRVEIRRVPPTFSLTVLVPFLTPLGGLLLVRCVVRRFLGLGATADAMVAPALAAWCLFGAWATICGGDDPIVAAGLLMPVICIVAPFLAVARAIARRQVAGPRAVVLATLLAIVAPNLMLAVAGGPGATRFTRSWIPVTSSPRITAYLDPEQRLFSDTALTGRYRQLLEPIARPGRRRVVVLGGSQTYGEGFTELVRPPIWSEWIGTSHPDWDVVNLAVQGSTLASQVVRLRHYQAVHPGERIDAIVAVFGLNDLAFLRATARRAAKIDAIRTEDAIPFAADPCAFVASCSAARLVGRAIPFILGRRTGSSDQKTATVGWALASLDELARAAGTALVLVREPDQCDLGSCATAIAPYVYPNAFDAVGPLLDELTHEPNVRVVDPRPSLRARRATQPFFDAVHFSEAGHRAMAGALEPIVVELLP